MHVQANRVQANKVETDAPSPAQLAKVGHWSATLALSLECKTNKTVIAGKCQTGPYTVQRPFYPEASHPQVCHLILLHPPGGLVEGDTLSLDVDCQENVQAFLTTPSAGKVYQCDSAVASQLQNFSLKPGSSLEWFPQETIVYDQSLSDLSTVIDLSGNARFAGWEIVCLGRPIANDFFKKGRVSQSIKLLRDGSPLIIDRINIGEQCDTNSYNDVRSQPWGLMGYSVTSTFMMTNADRPILSNAQSMIETFIEQDSSRDMKMAVTLIEDILIVRALAHQSRHVKELFNLIWSENRQACLQLPATDPRIWKT